MPAAQHNSNANNARRFAALWAGFDLGNSSEEEALGKARAMRRMAAETPMRIIDLLETPEVREALDRQMQPKRQASDDLRQAMEETSALRDELTERTRDVRHLAELLREKDETELALRGELAATNANPSHGLSQAAHPSFGAQTWVFEIAAIVVVVLLLIASLGRGTFFERSKSNGLAGTERKSAPLVRKGRAILSVPKPGVVHRGVHSGGPSAWTR